MLKTNRQKHIAEFKYLRQIVGVLRPTQTV